MQFLIVGSGSDFPRIHRRSAELGLTNVRFLPVLDEAAFRGLLAASDVCLVTQQKAASEIAFPSKIVTYLAAGRPVVSSVSRTSEVARITIESGAGRVAEAEDAEALLSAIQELRRGNPHELSKNARQYASRRWSSERVLGSFERNLARVAFPPRAFGREETSQ